MGPFRWGKEKIQEPFLVSPSAQKHGEKQSSRAVVVEVLASEVFCACFLSRDVQTVGVMGRKRSEREQNVKQKLQTTYVILLNIKSNSIEYTSYHTLALAVLNTRGLCGTPLNSWEWLSTFILSM